MSRRVLAFAAALLVTWPATAALAKAPAASPEATLEARLDPALASSVRAITADAAKRGLPTQPLVATALEGAARGVGGTRILGAVRAHAAALGAAAEALGPRATEAEIVAGASAIRARVAKDFLRRLRSARRGSVVIPLVVAADMVARGVPPDAASEAVMAAARAGVGDPELLRLREHVAHDIRAGTLPQQAARTRTRALVGGEGVRDSPFRR